MKKIFYIVYVVDTGYEYLQDTAVVVAENETDAITDLKNSIGKLGSDYWVDEVLSIEEFRGSVFTQLYGGHRWLPTK